MDITQKIVQLKENITQIKNSQLIGASDSCSYLIVENQEITFTGTWTSLIYIRFKSSSGKFFPKAIAYVKGYVNDSQVSDDRVIPQIMSQRSLFDNLTGASYQASDECIFAISLNGGGGGNTWNGKLVVTIYADCKGVISWGTSL